MANASRRGILAALALAPVPAVGRTIVADTVNPVLARLIQEHATAEAAYEVASDEWDTSWQRYLGLGGRPERHAEAYTRDGDVALCIHASGYDRASDRRFYSDDFIAHLRREPRTRAVIRYTTDKPGGRPNDYHEPTRTEGGVTEYGIRHSEIWPEAQARAQEIVAAYDRREAEDQRRKAVSGYGAAQEASSATADVVNRALHAVMKAKVETIADVVAKVGVLVGLSTSADALERSIDLDEDIDAASALLIALDLYRLTTGARS